VPDAALAQRLRSFDLQPRQARQRLGRLDGAQQVARIDGRHTLRLEGARRRLGLRAAERGERRRRVSAEAPLGVTHRLPVAD
jgi:hypothetical protein